MVKPVQKAEISSFVKGLITEASPLNFPADASRDEENFVLNIDGSRDRRLGIDFESNYQLRSTGFNSDSLKDIAVSTFRWLGAGNNSSNEFSVIQFGDHVDIYDTGKSSISADGFLGQVILGGVSSSNRFSYAAVDGLLVITAGTENIHIIKYDNPSFTYYTRRILVRDQWGLPWLDGNDLNVRTSSATDSQIYNLRNQGWGIPRKDETGNLKDPITIFNDFYHKFPAVSESVYTGLQFQPVATGTPFERIYPNLYDDSFGMGTPPARGYFIIDALRRGNSRYDAFLTNQTKFSQTSSLGIDGSTEPEETWENPPIATLLNVIITPPPSSTITPFASLNYPITSLPTDMTTDGATVVAEFAGRVFFGGFNGEIIGGDVNSPLLSSYIFFSQLVKGQDDIIKCYQVGDPTSRENSDLVDTDGGFIRISGAKKIYGLHPQGGSLFVLADNGVWQIQGGNDFGFSATNYSVKKLSIFGCNNTDSIVVVNDKTFFWGDSGIFVISKNQYGDWLVTNISEPTIQEKFDEIESKNREKAVGIYDPFDKKVRWIYSQDTDQSNLNIVFELVLNVTLNAFSITRFYNLEENTPEVIGFTLTAPFLSGSQEEDVVDSDVLVLVDGVQTVITGKSRESGIQSIKYLTLYGDVGGKAGYTFSQYKNVDFRDWFSADDVGVDAKAFVLTGTITAGDSSIFKQVPYIIFHFIKTEEGVVEEEGNLIPAKQSSCLVRSQWDWANSPNSGKWSSLFQAYRYRRPYFITDSNDDYDNGFETVVTKNKLRGRGRALSIYLETEPYKDCQILGWNLSLTGNSLA